MQKKKAISLIVLVITIIVMIVLAGAIILSLNNSGIIGKANQAVKFTDEATVKELAQMAWAEAYADGVISVEDTKINGKDVEGFKKRVEKALEDNDINKDGNIQYFLNVTDKGVTVKPIEEAWVLNQKELKVKRGEEELTIGQTVTYDEGVDAYTGGWKVLGADADGNLLIMSDTDVATVTLGGTTVDAAHKSWKTGVSDITKAAKEAIPLKTAPNAISIRSIEVEDIDKVTGYDKTTYGSKTTPYQYGNTVTYMYNGTIYITYIGTNRAKGELTAPHNGNFYWSDGKKLHYVTPGELITGENDGKTIATLTSNYYLYYPTTLTTSLNEDVKGIGIDTEAYKMLFRNSDNTADINYWLASQYVYTITGYARFGVRVVKEGYISGSYIFLSSGSAYTYSRGVRAVIVLQSDVPMSSLTK